MTNPYIECTVNKTSDVQLLQSNLTTFFYLGLILTVLRILKFVCSTHATSLKLNLHTENPLRVEFIVTCNRGTRNGNRTTVLFHITIGMTKETIRSIVFESSHEFTIAAYSPLFKCIIRIHILNRLVILTLLSICICNAAHSCNSCNNSFHILSFLPPFHPLPLGGRGRLICECKITTFPSSLQYSKIMLFYFRNHIINPHN